MDTFQRLFVVAALLSFTAALLHAIIGFSPTLSLYFGAPESLTRNAYALMGSCFFIAFMLLLFGLYALSGAGYIRQLPGLRPLLIVISSIFLLKGILFIPELMSVLGLINSSITVKPRFVVFSIASLLIGLIYLTATLGLWNRLPAKNTLVAREGKK